MGGGTGTGGLIPFHMVDIYDEDGEFTPGQIEAAEFLQHLDWEGGISGLWGHGGELDFPEELRPLALQYGAAEESLSNAINAWAEERGVSF